MSNTLSAQQDVFRGVVRRIVSVNRIDITIDLPFGIAVTRTVTLEDVRSSDFPNDVELRDRAQHCLIVLLGGKNVAVVPAPNEVGNWRAKGTTVARVYRNEKVYGEPVGYTSSLPGFPQPLLEVSSFYTWLRERGFPMQEMLAAINVRKGSR